MKILDKENILPDVIIAGAPKCGSTSLFNWLSGHPEICASSVKETYFLMDVGYPLFNPSKSFHTCGLEGYGQFFNHCVGDTRLRLEATPDYLYQNTALEVIRKLPATTATVFILRKPSDRVYSLFQFARNNLAIIDKQMSFYDFVRMIMSGKDSGMLHNRPILQNAISHSQYIDFLQPWLESGRRVHVSIFEDMRDDPRQFMVGISNWLGIDDGYFKEFDFSVHNSTYVVRNQFLHRAKRKLATILPYGAYRQIFQKIYSSINTQSGLKKTEDDKRALKMLDAHFSPYNEILKNQLKINISAWN